MPVPKKRHSKSRQGKRRANWKLTSANLSKCPGCGSPILPHHACPACGTYQGRSVIIKKEKEEKKAREKGKGKQEEGKEKVKGEKEKASKKAGKTEKGKKTAKEK